jgi:hypothetical protein
MALLSVSMAVTLVVASLVPSSGDSTRLSHETQAKVVLSVQQYVMAGCVFILRPAAPGEFTGYTERELRVIRVRNVGTPSVSLSPHLLNTKSSSMYDSHF